ncbi:agmatinase family protein [Aureispira anguillae]|uniref:Agmatinase family protein n=1 Tax=Aureispira anguillae TaxID=2864201 RepID=A0A915YBB7_9BACT|nr:agmatinase family protein [Aureispira anguillae]BDS09930.1 agmatinase family protein [Aureispira anguillae]
MLKKFDPNSYAVKNGNFIGLPYTQKVAKVVLLPVPWEATVSYAAGTALGPSNILEASYQLDLVDWDFPNAWETPIFMAPVDPDILALSNKTRALAIQHIDNLEQQKSIDTQLIDTVNFNSTILNNWVYQQSKTLLEAGKRVGLVGGEHSVPLGYLKALSEQYDSFGILQIDAHCDLRKAYEDFTYSHASIFYNALESIPQIQQLTQVAIRDACQEELEYAKKHPERICIYTMPQIRACQYNQNKTYQQLCQEIIATLPQKVYISFDIDGLDPKLCPNTGTPVPGGLEFFEAYYLLQQIAKSGRTIIGFDLCEVGSAAEWDGNVGARILYKLAVLLGHFIND